ncbi:MULTISPECIES: hypothetical protein [unclassified Caballeronia]|uniref:hypothetical protein n=1 Tax=unclassified Caballeronia TaxID=2646786 RepID=UPI002862DB89|nr:MULTISPECIES: hypothetical protein [unclassified Caballeronia]MDR5776878.1 hypothetical protein [Caballeronia sp. LZ002]MDR5798816.1 hypothetical protein [Caballeronia sp. LZ001]MDR5852337.1 hypothetical protein [Caballeronia sp. LZ003]
MGSILEMLIVLVGAALLTVQGIKEDIAAKRQNMLQIEGQNIASINSALGSYITNNFATLIPASFSQSTSTSIAAPTLAQLSVQANNKVSFKSSSFWGGTYQIAMSVVPASCSTAAGNCHIATQIYPSTPLMKSGTPDIAGAGIITAAGGSQFGYSTNRAPGTITGNQGQWTLPNPAGNRAGMVLAINGFGSDGNSSYYRRDGALPLTGTMNANNQDMQNVGNVTLGGGKVLKLQAGNSVQIDNGAMYYGDSVNAAVRTKGALYVQNYQGTGSAPINVGDVNSSGTLNGNALTVNTATANVANINAGAANCGWNGVTIRNNLMYVCNKWGNWVGVSSLVSNQSADAQYTGYYNGWGINPPACGAGGSAWYRIIPQSVTTDYSNHNPPIAGARFGMGWNGSQWVLQIYDVLADGANTLVADQLGLQAQVDVGCNYSNQ